MTAERAEKPCMLCVAYKYELGEAEAELARHHRDFERISFLLDEWAEPFLIAHPERAIETLRKIKAVVG